MKRFILANNNFYRKWSNQRDEAAERLLDNSKRRNTMITDRALVRVIEMIHARYSKLTMNGIPNHRLIRDLDHDIESVLHDAARSIYAETIHLRRMSWLLSHVAEAFAVATIAREPVRLKATHDDMRRLEDLDPKLLYRIAHQFDSLRRKIMVALGRSIIGEDPLVKAIGKVFLVFPKRETMSSVRKLKRLTKVREAASPKNLGAGDALILGNNGKLFDWNFDSVTWGKLIDEYNEEAIVVDRSPANVFDIEHPFSDKKIKDDIAPEDAVYGWEVEQETTHDFVQAVRSGEISAAKENGVDDFMWVAILDKKTCERCCEWRDGLTSKEIAEKLEEDEGLKEFCDAIVPPAHFNCRCKPAPVSSSLGEYEPDTDVELDSWLNSLQ